MTSTLLPLLLACTPDPQPWARATTLETLDQGIGGPKAMGRPGDLLLENDQVRFVILSGRNSLGPGLYGGSILDVDLQRADPRYGGGFGNDRFAELFPTVNMNITAATEPDDVLVLADGSDGGPAIVRAIAPSEPFLRLLAGLWALINAPEFTIATDYILEPGARYVTMRTTAFFGPPDALPDTLTVLAGEDEALPVLELALETGVAFGDFFLQGGDVDVFAPGMGFDEDGAVWQAAEEGRNTFEDPFILDFIAGTADGVSYALGGLDGQLFVPLFTSSQTAGFGAGLAGDPEEDERFPALTALTYERVLSVGDGDVGSALEGVWAARQAAGQALPLGRVEGYVVDAQTRRPVPGAKVFVYEPGATAPLLEWTADVSWDDHSPDGSFGGALPAGDWELLVHQQGRAPGERIPVSLAEGQTLRTTLLAARFGDVRFEVRDEADLLVPAKISIFPDQGETVRDPVLGDGYIAGDPEAVLFCPYGACEAQLPPGRYVAWATRGLEYELGYEAFTVRAGQPTQLELQVVRSVDTSGFISADLHVHAQPSHDSGVTPADRVATMVCEQVEFLISSDHDYITDYRPVIEDLALEPWVSAAVGLEVTPVELGHYIAFPLRHDNLEENGGAFDWTGLTPDEILDSLRALGDEESAGQPVTFVAHPRDGILGYFDQFGLSPYGGSPGEPLLEVGATALTNPLLFPENFSLDFDALEILNGKRYELLRTPTAPEMAAYAAGEALDGYDFMARTAEEQTALADGVYGLGYGLHGQVDDWFTLLNLGYRFTALGNSDTHGKTSIEAGCPRNYIASTTDDPAFLRPMDVAEAIRRGEVLATSGPFIRLLANGEHGIGSVVTGDQIELYIEVQSPTWFDVDRVELYRNGELVAEWAIETPNADVVNLATTWTDTPAQDAWYVVIALGDDSLEPLFTPTEYPPVQLQDVVTEALSGVPAVSSLLDPLPPAPRSFPTYPYGLTNPIWLDLDGDGFDPPGLPTWMAQPAEPAEE